MDQISTTYKQITSEIVDNAVMKIVNEQGNCTDLNICLACPFFSECCDSIKDKSKFLDKETRLRKAEEYLFDKALESEIG